MNSDDNTPVEPIKAIKETGLKPIEYWCASKKMDPAIMAAVKAVKHWGIGKEVSEADFDEAVDMTLNLKIGPV